MNFCSINGKGGYICFELGFKMIVYEKIIYNI